VSWRPACTVEALRERAALLRDIRAFFDERGVLEAQTPILAAATVTEPAVASIPVPGYGYLQTSPEYLLKRLLAAGAPSLYQLGPVFRAGERGRHHNPEFVMLEWYRLGYTDGTLMDEVADLVALALGPGEVTRVRYADVVARGARAAADAGAVGLSPRELEDLACAAGIESLGAGRFFITDYPAEQAALARLREGDPRVAARFELVVDGVELANGYWELGDADALADRFERDLAVRRERGLPLPPVDQRLLDAHRSGLPDCAGVALGFDRLLMLRLGAGSLAEVMPFPADRA